MFSKLYSPNQVMGVGMSHPVCLHCFLFALLSFAAADNTFSPDVRDDKRLFLFCSFDGRGGVSKRHPIFRPHQDRVSRTRENLRSSQLGRIVCGICFDLLFVSNCQFMRSVNLRPSGHVVK